MRLPDDSHRHVIMGKTGSGKTVAGIWHLSKRSWRRMPWIIFNWKRDKLIGRLPAEEIKGFKLPTKPGLYVINPMPEIDDDEIEAMLWRIHAQGNIGLYVDEGYMLPYMGKSKALQAILTQGRSLRIPTIILSQRPVWLSRFVTSEADFLQVFWLNDERDRKTLLAFMPKEAGERLPDFHSHYYDVGRDKHLKLGPVLMEDEIVASFGPPPKKRSFLFTV